MSITFHCDQKIVHISNDTISYVMEVVAGSIWFTGISERKSGNTGGPAIPFISKEDIIQNMLR